MFIIFYFFWQRYQNTHLFLKIIFHKINTTHVKQKKRFTYNKEELTQIIKTLVKKNSDLGFSLSHFMGSHNLLKNPQILKD